MAKRSTQMVVIGAAVFLVGAGLVFVGLRSGWSADTKTPAAPAATTEPGRVVVQGGATALPDVVIPRGMTAVAVRFDDVPGLVGYIRPGDHINVYATSKGGEPARVTCEFAASSATSGSVACRPGAKLTAPYAKLVLPNVEVLDVVGGGVATGPQTFVLALNERDAERAIFFAKFESLWATLVPDAYVPRSTSGRDYGNALKGVAR